MTDSTEPDANRVPTERDHQMAGQLSTIWPMSSRHPGDAIHLAIHVNDLLAAENKRLRSDTLRAAMSAEQSAVALAARIAHLEAALITAEETCEVEHVTTEHVERLEAVAVAARELIGAYSQVSLHVRRGESGTVCNWCGTRWPCSTADLANALAALYAPDTGGRE